MKTQKTNDGSLRIQPLQDRVLIRAYNEDSSETTKSGIFLPESIQKEKTDQGIVLAVGEGHYENGTLIPMRVKVGDTILFSKYGYEEVKVDGVDYMILKEDSILAVIK